MCFFVADSEEGYGSLPAKSGLICDYASGGRLDYPAFGLSHQQEYQPITNGRILARKPSSSCLLRMQTQTRFPSFMNSEAFPILLNIGYPYN